MPNDPTAPTTPPPAGAPDATTTSPAAPQVGAPATPPTPTTPPASPAVADPQVGGADESGLTPDQLKAELARVRREAAQHRTRLKAFEDAQAAADAAKLSDLEKAQRQIATLQQAEADRTRAYQELTIRYAITQHAQTLDIVDPDAAMKLLDWSEIEFDDAGQPKNIAKLLEKLLADKPYLKKIAAPGVAGAPVRPTAGGPTAPGAGQIAGSAPSANPREWAKLGEKSLWRK